MAMDIVEVDAQEVIKSQQQTIIHLSDYLDKLVGNQNKIRGLVTAYDCGDKTADMVMSYLKLYM